MERSGSLVGMEVPITGGESLKWFEVTVSSAAPPTSSSSSPPFAPLTEDSAAGSVIGDPPAYLIWRIHKSQPCALDIVEFCAYKEFPRTGMRIIFPDALCPFAFICKDEISCTSGNPYLLYALTVSGVAYLFKLRNLYTYESCSIFPSNDLIELNLKTHPHCGEITAAAAASGCLVIGRSDGSVHVFQLGMFDQSAPDFVHELRDDAGIGRLWGYISRGRVVAPVQDLVISEVVGRKLVFVLHFDGILRVWDLLSHNKVFSCTMSTTQVAGATFLRLWVGEANYDTSIIPLAILCRRALDINTGIVIISIYSLHFSVGDRTTFFLEPSIKNISSEEGRFIDVKLTSNKIWMLKEDGLTSHDLFHTNTDLEGQCYALQETFVADQLFQSSEHCLDDLLLITHSVFSSVKDQIVSFVSSIFLRRLLHPGVHHNIALRATLQDYNKQWTDSEFQTLTVDGLKKEILSAIEHEGIPGNPGSVFYCWKNFCTRYFHYWCKNSASYGLFVDSTGAVGLIRKDSLSLFRCLEDIELLIYGPFDELGDFVNPGFDLYDDDLEREILFEVLRCVSSMSQQLGKTASALFYESLISAPIISSEEIVPRLLKILETGYSSSVAVLPISDLGADGALGKELAVHKTLRKFSVDMLLSLHALYNMASSWSRVLNVIESYLKFLVPQKITQGVASEVLFNINTSILVQATSQVAKVMFESALDILLLLSYLVNISGQVNMLHDDISRIQLELVPMIQEIVTEWLIIYFFGTTPSESPALEDFNSQLSSLQIDSNSNRKPWNEKLGKCDFTLACILLLNIPSSSGSLGRLSSKSLLSPHDFISSVRDFTSWMIWGGSGEESPAFFSHSTELARILLKHGQYDAAEYLLTIVDAHSRKEKISGSVQSTDGGWCMLHHLLGCCLLAQAQGGLNGKLKEKKVCEAVRCFFRASSGKGASQALQSLSSEAGWLHLGFNGYISAAAWKLHYYQWAMQIFEQHNISEGACQFALAALEQVDEALGSKNNGHGVDPLNELATAFKGRLWANVFKFTLDVNQFYDAYCAIISNPDEESKYICLRRFIIVLYERGAIKLLCDGQLPFIGLTEKVERELAWKAERSDIAAKPNPYKLLYAFEMYRHNWRRAATYIYLYSARLRTESVLRDCQNFSLTLQERLNGLSAAINVLHLVHPAHAWINPHLGGNPLHNEHYPSKKAKKTVEEQSPSNDAQRQKLQSYVDVEKLENEFVLTTAEYLLLLANVKWTFTGMQKLPSDLVELLVETSLYDMAFTVVLKFWKGSGLKRELERIFVAMSLKCCPNRAGSLLSRTHGLLLTSSKDDTVIHGSLDPDPSTQQSKGNNQWETLELYLEKYKGFNATLPVIVAETLLRTDPQIELPLWLVHMFKSNQRESCWGMTGQESNPATLFRLYVNHGRYTEATSLLLEYIESFASTRPADLIHRKRPSAVWFPYTTIERLWCQLEEMISSGNMVDQCYKLKNLLRGALERHLNLLKVDSDDALSSSA